jgi:hypothetical protein
VWIDPHQNDIAPSPREAGLLKTARTVGQVAVWLAIPLTSFTCAGYIQSDLPPGFGYMVASMVLRFLVLWFALHFPLAGGMLLIADGALSAWFSRGQTPAGVLGFVLIPAGILFVLTWRERRRNLRSHREAHAG